LLLKVSQLAAQSQTGLSACFDFNDGTTENKVNSKLAKGVGTLFTEDRFGNAEKSIQLQGSRGSYLNLGTDSTVKPRAGTISLWVYIDRANYQGQGFKINPILLTKNCECDDFFESYAIAYDFNTHHLSTNASLSEYMQVTAISKNKIDSMRWYHVIMAYNDDSLYFYINGQLQSALVKNFQTQFSNKDSVMIGNSGVGKNERFLTGRVDDIYIYNRVLSPKEIKELYEAPNPNRYKTICDWILKILSVILLVVILVWFFVRRNKKTLQRKQEHLEMQAKLNEMETRAIRMQMNPHFIFNALNSLQRLILEANTEDAHTYVSKFSKLLRRILESADAEYISLQEEIEILESYIAIEKIRFGYSFEYKINCEMKNAYQIFIPFMLVQPMIENAIWHGLLPKKGDKLLTITFKALDENHIVCEVEDNGVGREYSKHKVSDEVKKRSMSIGFINQRFYMMKKMTGKEGSLTFTDKFNPDRSPAGTLVKITIPKQ
jgi:hypothetical protein